MKVRILPEIYEKYSNYQMAFGEHIEKDPNATFDVISIERGWYRIFTEFDEDYLFPPENFEIVEGSPDEYVDKWANKETK